jgi:ribosome-associated protein
MGAQSDAVQLARSAAEAALDKGGTEPIALDVSGFTPFADVFLVVTGETERNVQTIADSVADRLREAGHRARASEGRALGQWALLDFGGVVVHVMQPEAREFYALERVWRDAPVLDLALPASA